MGFVEVKEDRLALDRKKSSLVDRSERGGPAGSVLERRIERRQRASRSPELDLGNLP